MRPESIHPTYVGNIGIHVSNKIAIHHRIPDSINVSFDMDALWKKSKISLGQQIRNRILLLPSVRFKVKIISR